MKKMTYRNIQNFLLFITLMALGFSFYFEYAKGLQPCPLCLMQRLSAFIFGFFCMLGLCSFTLHRARIIALFQIVFSAAGLYFSARQVWLQFFAVDQTSMCMPGMNALMHYFSWSTVLKALFWGAADCGEVTWQFLGLSMPTWSAFYFFVIFITCGVVFYRLNRSIRQLPSLHGSVG